jgi:hypothetical protein
MTATINTKSNFRNLNGKTFPVYEIVNNRVTIILNDPEFIKPVKCDFSINEVTLNLLPNN